MKFSAAQAKDARRPLAVQEVPPRVWAQTWLERPLEVVIVGFRSLAETTLSEITGAAQTHANRIVPAGEGSALWADEYSAAVRFLSLGRAMTQPDCADAPWWDYADLLAPQAFSPEGAAWLYARFSAAVVAGSPLASDEDPEELAGLVLGLAGAAADMSAARRSQVARHLRAALDVLQGR